MSSSPRSIRGFTMSKLGVVIPPMSRPPSSRPGDYEVAVPLDVLDEPALLQDSRHHRRKGRELQLDLLRPVVDAPPLEVDVELVAVVDPVRVHDDRGQSDVDAVPVEDAGERLREDRPRPRDLDDQGRMLPGRALPEVPPADDEVPRPHLLRALLPGVLEDVLRELGQVRPQVVVPPRGDQVRGDVVPELPRAARHTTSRGSVITPQMVVA